MGLKKYLPKILIAIVAIVLIGGGTAYYFYKTKATNINTPFFVKLNNNDNIETLTEKLTNECGLKYPFLFKKIAHKMNLERWMKRGRYELKPEMTMVEVVKLFRAGKSQTVNFTIKGLSSIESFANLCGEKLEPDAQDFMFLLSDSVYLDTFGFTPQTIYAMLLPDTYNTFWHTQADELMQRLYKEYNLYWDENKLNKAKNIGLSPIEVAILASIVSKETNKKDEMPAVASMYINRLNIGMPLQADPTVKFALNDPTLKRIYNTHLQVNSPYNTYKNKGLPPGPICIPSKQAIEAVLNYTPHNYLFMCAKEDFSGYHNFATTYSEHLLNAKRYQAALDRRAIN